MAVSLVKVKEQDDGMRLNRWFLKYYPNLPLSRLQKLLRTKQIKVDGKKVEASLKLQAGWEIRIPPLEDKPQEKNKDFELPRYREILEKNGLEWSLKSMKEADVSSLDAQCVMALIMGAVRAERFCDGALLGFFKNGSIKKWLKRLNEIDAK